ncbi:glycine/D-amino acid oxidase-like deaminating enzyme/nitrite reductase/ring-hydroxylating ferredoxin subunit [Clostridium moniliforme]|uniref:Glycine/D-amino acid oxidase-like deaminating enzyme/nitrite reductase/ring-hydroxylating ferredoxin subunit n=1 Tax=Clostridium moniliforme TaxID=39489 RepID=A0ABS4EY48_9CLOT|nr:FAD-dependent oxidoreductase [Clostridium moniliforme]MBP1888767.1 glycine/D-amino acid oxidase-like deaminating enzyme/nitrite reductase/ring-hydroxylating ferredoxin subunit [Clostridium moniliforme]
MKSVWSESLKLRKRETLSKDIETDVVVIGGGIAGLLIAYFLKKKGKEVVVIEAKEILSGNTKDTTAKITSQHDIIYSKLIKEFGKDKAKEYAYANELAIKKYKEIIKEENINCDFEEMPAYLYSLDNIDLLKDELEAAKSLGIDAELVYDLKLPFKVKGALKFNNQGQFNPLKFLNEIAKELVIYENTMAIDIKENLVITNKGKIKANNIVVATHFPFLNVPGYYFMRMHQERSYVIALENADDVCGMYIDINKNGYSFRNYKDLLLLGGIPKRTGQNEKGGSYDALRKIAKELYPKSKEKYCWSAQDCMTLDGIPYIGQYSEKTSNLYVATGFNKWGMTSAMVSAMILSDMITGKENNFSEIFSPKRFDMSLSINNLIEDGLETAKNYIAQKIYIPDSELKDIRNGYGGVIEYKGDKVGVYKDKEGKGFFVTTKCPHLGCELHWNSDELSWDCPCHGSRFDYKGNWLGGPATKGLKDD